MATKAQVLNEMTANPEAFLRHYLVMIVGGAAATSGTPSGVATFDFYDYGNVAVPGFTTGLSGRLGITKNREKIRFRKRHMPPKSTLAADEFDAWYVAMAVSGSDVQTTHTMVPGTGGPDIMLTSQLSGCTFGIGSATTTGDRLVSHIQPLDTDTGRADMHNEMLAGLNAGGVDAVFEKENRPGAHSYGGNASNRTTIIGVRHNGHWGVYAQTYNNAQGAAQIYKVERIA
jgi:hypothetical protein